MTVDHGLWVDRDADVPIGVQLAWAIKMRIADGSLRDGQRLPGLRDLADALRVNANTVRAVYAKLERDGLLESRQGSGTFVAAGAGRPRKAGKIAARAAREAAAADIDPREVASILYVRAARPDPADAQVDRRNVLRAQIATLEQALGELEAEHPRLVRAAREHDRVPTARAQARLPSTDELEQVKASLLRRLSLFQAEIDALQQGRASEPADAVTRRRSSEPGRTKPAAGTRKAPRAGGGSTQPAAAGA
jgi:DNA-binding transcriptional regulator YhcF (GntR family)